MAGDPDNPAPFRADPVNEHSALQAIVDHVADGIVIVSRGGLVRFANRAAESLFGRPADALIGEDFGFPVVDEESAEIDVLRPGGVTVVAELRMTEMEWEGERAILISLRDITDRREAEERGREMVRLEAARSRAEEEKRRFRLLARASALLDSSLDYLDVLNQLARLLVRSQREVAGDPGAPHHGLADWCVIDVVEPDGSIGRIAVAHGDPSREQLLRELRERFPPGWSHPYPAARAIREREATIFPDIDDDTLASLTRGPEHAKLLRRLGLRSAMAVPMVARGEIVGAITLARARERYSEDDLVVAGDLAQRAALSLANARLYREANDANRAKSDFLAVMSHELRTPLNAVMGYTDLLQAEISGPLTEKQGEQLGRIASSSQHLLRIVDEILSYARLEAGRAELQVEPVDLRTLFNEVGAMVEPQATAKGLQLEVDDGDQLPVLTTDPGKVRQILLNLLSNAVKFTDEGEIHIGALTDGPAHQISVRDTGAGIPAESLAQIFEPFWQVEQGTRRSIGGTGLGLSVAARLARLLGGTLQVESEVGEGSRFTLFLPISPEDANA